jgi:trigger factor
MSTSETNPHAEPRPRHPPHGHHPDPHLEVEASHGAGMPAPSGDQVLPDDVSREFEGRSGDTRSSDAASAAEVSNGAAPAEIEEEVRDYLVRHGLQVAFDQHKVFPLHNPVVEGGKVTEGEPYTYTALFEVRPTLHLGEYKGVSVRLPEAKVDDEEVEKALTALRERLARFIGIDPRPLTKGDFALVDLDGRDTSGKSKDFKHEGVMIEVGGESNLPEFNAALPGMTVGEAKTFEVVYPEDFEAKHLAGRTIAYTVSVRQIKVKEVPPADDSFRTSGRPALSPSCGKRPGPRRSLRANHERQARGGLLRHLPEANTVPVPGSWSRTSSATSSRTSFVR